MTTIRNHLPTAARLFLGLVFTIFGLNFFFHFIPQPPTPARASAFAGALFASGYLFQLLKTVEIASGLLLLTGRFVPLALALVAPIIVNILAFHLFLAPAGLPLPALLLIAELYLAWSYRAVFAPMLQARTPLPRLTSTAAARPIRTAA